MKKYLVLLVTLTSLLFSKVDSTGSWVISSVIGVNFNQVALSNWTQGGENALALSFFNNSSANYLTKNWTLKNTLKVAIGQTKLGTDDFRTNDNELFIESIFSYLVDWPVNPFASNSVRTVLTNGYDYKTTGFPQIAAFFDPGYITQSFGFQYKPVQKFSTRVGLSFQEIITNRFRKYSDDPKTTDKTESFKLDTGIESITEGSVLLMENINLASRLRLFGKFKELDKWDVRWDSDISAKINKYFSVNLNFLMVYQLDQSVKTQIKEALQIGFSYNLY